MLKKGDENADVANWQRFLISQGYSTVEADGDFGDITEKATKLWQTANGLEPDGKVGEKSLDKAESAKVNVGSQKPTTAPTVKISDEKLKKVHPNLAVKAQKVVELAKAEGYNLVITQGLRTFAEQDALFRKKPKVTGAKGGQSMHNYGFAVDFAFAVNGDISWDERLYRNIGRWADQAGLEWGGNWKRFKDLPHVQLKGLPSYKQLLPIYNSGGLDAVWSKYQG
jgi:LAS superfamily LD-carboxypeptidase LdcB